MSGVRTVAILALLPLVLFACSESTNVDPLGAGGAGGADSGAGATAGSGGTVPAPADTVKRIRTVEQRNPYGNTDIKNNLMVDGDFEWTGASGQYGWYAIANGQQAQLVRETGGLCHSGVACGEMNVGTDLLGQAAAPANEAMQISLWIKPPDGNCSAVNVSVIECSALLPRVLASVTPLANTPDASGWCHLEGTQAAMTGQPCLYLKTSEDKVLVDDASLVGVPDTNAKPLAATVPSPELYASIKRALDWVHGHMLIGRGRPGLP